jgi:hypothetical protein
MQFWYQSKVKVLWTQCAGTVPQHVRRWVTRTPDKIVMNDAIVRHANSLKRIYAAKSEHVNNYTGVTSIYQESTKETSPSILGNNFFLISCVLIY